MTNGKSTSLSWCQEPHLGPKTKFLLLSVAGLSMYGVLSDRRTGLSAVGPRRRSHSQVRDPRDSDHIFYCLSSRLPPNLRVRSPYLYPPGTGCPSYIPRHWDRFSSPLTTTRWATVEVLETASTRGSPSSSFPLYT
jgi:hypothetical protein